MAASRTRGAPRAPRLSPQQIAAEEAALKAKRKQARADAKTAKQAEAHEQNVDAAQRELDARAAEGEDVSAYFVDPATARIVKREAAPETDAAEQAARNIEAAKAEAAATGMSFEEACDSMGIAPDGSLLKGEPKRRYDGPMLALVAARKAYVTAANGQPCNGDMLATICGAYSREQVVKGLIAAMKLPNNPYAHLNPGQQSMNLRNKARAQIKAGILKHSDVDAALKATKE